MDMRIPFQITAKGMDRGDHAENHGIFEIAIKVIIVFIVMKLSSLSTLSFFSSVDLFIGNLAYRISGSYEKKVQGGPVYPEEQPVRFGDREDNVSVRYIDTHAFSFNSQFLLVFDTAGSTEPGMALSAEEHLIVAVIAFENIIAKIHGIAEKDFLNIIQNTGSCLSCSVHFYKP